MTSPEHPILQVLDAYRAAVLAKDVDAFVALYDPEVRIFDMWGTWLHEGLPAWRRMAQDWFGSLGSERVLVDFEDVRTLVGPRFAVVNAFVTYTAVSAAGEKLRSLTNRLTAALEQKDGEWKIVHEHTSAPLDKDTAKAIFQR